MAITKDDKNKILQPVPRSEEDQIARNLMEWINSYSDLPVGVVLYEQLQDDMPSMSISSIQGGYITRRYITGGHEAQYPFKLIYRIKPGTSMDMRLQADEILDKIADWAAQNPPDLGDGITNVRVRADSRAAVFAAYPGGDEDHQTLMTLIYEVI